MSEYAGELTHVEVANVPLWLIVLLPLLGATINAVFGRKLQASRWQAGLKKRFHIGSPAVTAVALGAMLGAFTLACVSLVQLIGLPASERYLYSYAWQMVRIGSLDVNFAFAFDPLSAVMTLIITGVGSLIHLYAASYMEKEPSYWRFFCYLNLFIFSMLLLVLGDNFIVMFFGWEGVGLCSYLLIGFWYKDYKKATAGMKAFVVNRIGDFGFICGMALLFWGLGGAWDSSTGQFESDFGPRFLAVEQQPLTVHGAEHGSDHAEAGHGAPGADAANKGHAKQAHGKKGHDKKEDALAKLRAAGKSGQLTMTTHPGARVFFGVGSLRQLQQSKLVDCRTKPAWNQPSGVQLTPDCYATSPFMRKRISAGLSMLVIDPGQGAVVTGRGDEVGAVRVRVKPGKETVLLAVGSTLTFREIQDQLVVKDDTGKTFIQKALRSKTVWGGFALIALACLLFFVGATGKSAQIPLFVWLPDAMAGPTPVSALIHAATMVTAGVYMIARLNFLFSMSPTACGVVAMVGALTALLAATIGFFQYDIKRVLAYSTVSQLGFMFIAVGVGAYWVGIFHLMTHAFFKACLFLASGSVIHGMHHVIHDADASQDMRNMGGLRAVMPKTALTYKIACMAITAAPPFLAGFWSKDEALWKAYNFAPGAGTFVPPGGLIYIMGLVAALGTSFYMWRSYYLTFEGKHATKKIKTKVHESPAPMTIVLIVLAFLSAVAGVLFGLSSHFTHGVAGDVLPHEPLLEQWLSPVMAHAQKTTGDAGYVPMMVLMAISVAGAAGAWALAKMRYGADRPKNWEKREAQLPAFTLLHNKYYVDEIYQASIVAAFMRLRLVLSEMDRWIVDGIVNGASVIARGVAWAIGVTDNKIVDGAVNMVANGTLEAGDKLRTVQTGRIQNYIYGILAGVAFFAIISYLLW